MKNALLVVDVDRRDGWYTDERTYILERRDVAGAMAKKLRKARKDSIDIVFATMPSNRINLPESMSLVDFKSKCPVCSDYESEFPRFLGHKHGEFFEPVFFKKDMNAFKTPNLREYLKSRDIERLLIAGCHTFQCIEATAKGAVINGFNVTLIRGCIFMPFSNKQIERMWIDSVESSIPEGSNITVTVE